MVLLINGLVEETESMPTYFFSSFISPFFRYSKYWLGGALMVDGYGYCQYI
jgi:hypothetical protein